MKNNAKSELRIGALLAYASMIIGYVVQIAYTPVMIRIIGQSQYGLYNLTNSIVSYLSLFSLGFGPAYVRFYMKHKTKNDQAGIEKMNGMFMVVFLILGILATISGAIMVQHSDALLGNNFSDFELRIAKKLMILMVINIAISFPLIPITSYIQTNERFIFQNSLNILRQVLNPFLSLPLLLTGFGALGMIFASTCISLIVGIWQIIYSMKKLRFRLQIHDMDFDELRSVAIFSSFIFLNAVADQINWNVDKFIIGRYDGAVTVAIYGIAAQLNTYYLNLSTVVSDVFVPRINRIVSEKKQTMNLDLTNLFIKIGRIQFMVVVLVLVELFFLGRPFIGFWAGENYYDSFPILMILIIPATIPLIQNAGISMQQAKNMHIFRSILYILIAIGNVLLSLVLVKKYGAAGTAFATAFVIVIGDGFLMNWYYKNKVGINITKFWKEITKFIPTVAISLITGFFSIRVFNEYSLLGFLCVGFIILCVYVTMLFTTGIASSERKSIINRIKHFKFI